MEKFTGVIQEILVDEFDCVYTIETLPEFCLRIGEEVRIPGPIFGSKSKHIQWFLTITLTRRATYRDCYSFRVKAIGQRTLDGDPLEVRVAISLSSFPNPHSGIVEFIENDAAPVTSIMYFYAAPTMTTLPQQLTVSFNFKVIQRKCTEPKSCLTLKECVPASVLQKSLKNLLDSGESADVTLVTSDGTIQAHKLLLMARSPVFQAMFATNMKEANNNEVEIQDFDKEAVSAMLEYIYTGHTDQVAKNPREMLHIADKYDLKELREVCISIVAKDLNVDNAVENLVLADRFQVTDFKLIVVKYFRTNHLEIAKTEDFKEFLKTNQELYLEALTGNLEAGK